MRKQLTVVTALAVVAASAAPAAARPVVPFPPGTSDAAQGGYESPPPAGTAVATDLRGEFARAAAEPPVPVTVDVQAPAADGLDWTSVGLGAGGGLVAVLTAGGVVLMARRGVRVGASR